MWLIVENLMKYLYNYFDYYYLKPNLSFEKIIVLTVVKVFF